MKILYFTKSKPYTCEVLRKLYAENHEVTIVCKNRESFEGTEMDCLCQKLGATVYDHDTVNDLVENNQLSTYDLGISNTYGRLIRPGVINHLNGKIFNLHAAPLPWYKGMFAYNWAIFNQESQWGVTAHYVNEKFDEGAIIEMRTFPIDPLRITVKELERESQRLAAEMTLQLVQKFEENGKLAAKPQESGGRYYSREDFERLKQIQMSDSAEVIRRKIHACWCPPYEGAYWEHDGVHFVICEPEFLGGNL